MRAVAVDVTPSTVGGGGVVRTVDATLDVELRTARDHRRAIAGGRADARIDDGHMSVDVQPSTTGQGHHALDARRNGLGSDLEVSRRAHIGDARV